MDNFKAELKNIYLYPKDAAAIIIKYKNYFLLQLRDNKPNIFFPNKLGLFGGAMKKNEKPLNCVQREVREELNLDLIINKISYITNVSFEIKKKIINRYIYLITIDKKDYEKIKISEGQKVEKIKEKFLLNSNLAPYDYLALWIYLDLGKFKV